MPESETFDAFYARTVWFVTTQMHELAGDDGMADHAIREAYAKAYQQWYQVSGYADSQAWVLGTARDAFARRQAEAGGTGSASAAPASDSGTWPGIYRPVADQAPAAGPADPDATMARPSPPGAASGTGGYAGRGYAGVGYGVPDDGVPDYGVPDYGGGGAADGSAGGAGRSNSRAGTRAWFPGLRRPADPAGPAGLADTIGPANAIGSADTGGPADTVGIGSGHQGGRPGPALPASRRTVLIAGAVVAALLIGGIVYATTGGGGHTPAAGATSSARPGARAQPHMLSAGKTGPRSAVPWSLVGTGWALAEVSTAQPAASGTAAGTGTYTTYLVDPDGGKYTIAASTASAAPRLMAWSGDARTALFGANASGTDTGPASYSLLNVATGRLSPLPLPSGVSAVGFTRPKGLAVLAVRQVSGKFRLQHYSLTGGLEGAIGTLPDKHASAWPAGGCSFGCALSSPDGDTDVWGIFGDEMQLLSNAGGLIRRLHVPGSGQPSSCVPLSWWNSATILANCAVTTLPGDAARLWLVPANGSQPTPLTQAAAAGTGQIEGAWAAGPTTYVTSVLSRQCPSAPSGSAGLGIGQNGSGSTIAVPGTTGNASTIVGAAGQRLLVLAQTNCPGTSSLLWFSPAAKSVTTVLSAPGTQAGVIAAVPYGNGPTAVAAGQ